MEMRVVPEATMAEIQACSGVGDSEAVAGEQARV